MRVLIVRNNYNPKALDASYMLETFFDKQGIEHAAYDSDALRTPDPIIGQLSPDGEPPFNLAVVLGGDGTILCTADQIRDMRIPILGINFGHLGFMANPNDDGVIAIVSAALAGDVVSELRTNLSVEVYVDEKDAAENALTDQQAMERDYIQPAEGDEDFLDLYQAPKKFFALNEMVVARGDQGRIIHLKYGISGAPMADVRGDGLIVATATGSTGYALSVGGPLVNPSHKGLVVAPIAPHTLQSRAVVTGHSDVVEIDLDTSFANREATLFIDGERIEFDSPIRKVIVKPGAEPTILLRYKSNSFYHHAATTFFNA